MVAFEGKNVPGPPSRARTHDERTGSHGVSFEGRNNLKYKTAVCPASQLQTDRAAPWGEKVKNRSRKWEKRFFCLFPPRRSDSKKPDHHQDQNARRRAWRYFLSFCTMISFFF